MVKALHRAGIEVILDVVYNHTAEGNHLGPMLSFSGIDNASLLPADAGRPAPLHGLHGHRQHAQPGAPERAAADHGLAALLGHRVPRRRLPLRPRLGARARVLRRRPPLGVLRRHPPGPGALAGEADRRAVGPRARAATRSATSRCSGRSGTASTATRCATSGAAQTNASPRSRRASPARATSTRTTAATRPRRSTSSPRTTASRCRPRLVQRASTTRRTARATATARDDNRSWNCGVEGPTDDPEVLALRARQQRNFLATLLLSQGVPMILGGDEMRPHAARQQQRLVPGQRDLVGRLGARRAARGAARVHAPPARAAPRASRSSAARSSSTAGRRSRCSPTPGGSGPTAGA